MSHELGKIRAEIEEYVTILNVHMQTLLLSFSRIVCSQDADAKFIAKSQHQTDEENFHYSQSSFFKQPISETWRNSHM